MLMRPKLGVNGIGDGVKFRWYGRLPLRFRCFFIKKPPSSTDVLDYLCRVNL